MDKKILIGGGVVLAIVAGIYLYRTSKNVSAAQDESSVQLQSSAPAQISGGTLSTFAPAVNAFSPIVDPQAATNNPSSNAPTAAPDLPYVPAVINTAPVVSSVAPVASIAPVDPVHATLDADYMMLFGRHPDAGGEAYWKGELASGHVTTQTLLGSLARGANVENGDAAYQASKFGTTFTSQ